MRRCVQFNEVFFFFFREGVTNIYSISELVVKDCEDGGQCISIVPEVSFDMLINLYAETETINDMVDDVFDNNKLDVTEYDGVVIDFEFNSGDSGDLDEFLSSVLNAMSVDIDSSDEYGDQYDDDEPSIEQEMADSSTDDDGTRYDFGNITFH